MKLFKEIFKKCLFPTIIIVILVVFYGTYLTQFREKMQINWSEVVKKGFLVLSILVVTYWIRSLFVAILGWYQTRLASKTETATDDKFIPLFKRLVSIVFWTVGIIIVLSSLGININALVATLGVTSLAVALAAQDTISNIIAGFLIMIDRPFKIGDEIKLPTGEKVKVLSIGIRRSKFHLIEDGSLVIVPNIDLSKSKIVNYSESS